MAEVTIWCTYDLAGSLHSSGLEMVLVWFSKPQYHFIKNTRDWEDEDLPFGQENEQREGVQRFGWRANEYDRGETKPISFGRVFGYESNMAKHVWNKLCLHFNDPELRHWSDIEREGKAKPSDFLLEIKIDITNFK